MSNPDSTPKCRILIIDDNKNIHIDFRKVLIPAIDTNAINMFSKELFGDGDEQNQNETEIAYEIDSAYQGKDGVELIKQSVADSRPYSVAFVDMRMPPGWDGLTTIERAWEVDPRIQVVICTAYADYSWKDIIKRLKNTNNLLILKKPFENIEVKQITRSLTEKWQLIANLEKRAEELKASQENLSITLIISIFSLKLGNPGIKQHIPRTIILIFTPA